jgi:hypothetical protein
MAINLSQGNCELIWLSYQKSAELLSTGSLKKQLQYYIGQEIASQFSPFLPTWEQIPLKMCLTEQHLCYHSAIALKFCQPLGYPPEKLTRQIKQQLIESQALVKSQEQSLDLPFSVQIHHPEWLTFTISYDWLLPWLTYLEPMLQTSISRDSLVIGIDAPSPIADIQYTHARACTWLRLRTIEKNTARVSPLNSEVVSLVLPPVLSTLLEQVLRILDEPENLSPKQWQSQGLALSKKFLDYEAQAWQSRNGNNQSQSPNQQKSNLQIFQENLILITQALLQQLLVDKLGYPAPTQL